MTWLHGDLEYRPYPAEEVSNFEILSLPEPNMTMALFDITILPDHVCVMYPDVWIILKIWNVYLLFWKFENISRIFPNLENITLGELYLVDTFLEQLTVVMASGEGR